MTRSRSLRLLLVTVLLLVGAAACSSGGDGDAATTTTSSTPAIDVDGAVVIDVRTAAEFAEGHLEGARNIDIQSPDFAEKLRSLDKARPHVVYCRSGNRSAAAVAQMRGSGFTDVVDAGGLDAASAATGLRIVTD